MNTTQNNLVAAAKRAGRNALDESAGKQLLAAHGVKVPQSRVAKGVADVDAVMNGLQTPLVVKVMSPDILHKSDAGGVKINLHSAAEVKAAIEGMLNAPKIKGVRIASSRAALECRLVEVHSYGRKRKVSLVIAEVVQLFVDDALLVGGVVDPTLMQPIARLGGENYASLGRRFSLPRP